jgi:hypothetical protein
VFDPRLITCQQRQLLICRTAGLWGHARRDGKEGEPEHHGQVIDASNGVLHDSLGELIICGEHLVNTAVNDGVRHGSAVRQLERL